MNERHFKETEQRALIAQNIRDYISSILTGVRKYEMGSEMERGYILEKVNKMKDFIENNIESYGEKKE